MTTDQVLFGVGLIVVLAVGSQILASQLRIPALIILLPVGFTAGALTMDVNPQHLLGASFQPLVSLAVAVILYDAGLGLDLAKLRGHTRRVVFRLIAVGVPVTWALAAVFAGLLFGMSAQATLMIGVILVVSGPTVVGPLLRFIRPTDRLQRVLAWEGSLIDPVGAIVGAVVFHAVLASPGGGLGYRPGQFVISIAIGVAGAVAGVAVLWLCLHKLDLGEVLGTTSQLACVVGVAAICDVVRDDAGLVSAILMGLAVVNLRGFDIPARRPFFETLVQLIIGVLFITISATVGPASLHHLVLPALGLVAVLVIAARPLVAFLATIRTDLTRGERQFTGWMAPRGIVAAATASTFGTGLATHHVAGAAKILPVTFLVIVATVAIYGLTAVPVAPVLPALASSPEFDLEGHPLLFRTIGGADGALATIVHVPEMRAVCSGDIAYNNIHMWLWRSTPDSREAWLASLDAVAALNPSTIITGHKDPSALDDDAARVLDQSRRYIEQFGQAVAKSSTPRELIEEMLALYPTHGNRYTLFAAASSQFPG